MLGRPNDAPACEKPLCMIITRAHSRGARVSSQPVQPARTYTAAAAPAQARSVPTLSRAYKDRYLEPEWFQGDMGVLNLCVSITVGQ